MLSSPLALTRSLQIDILIYFTSKSFLSYWRRNFDKSQLSCAKHKTSIFLEVHCNCNTKSLQIPRDLESASGRCLISSFLCSSNKPLLSIKCNTGPLLSLSVIIFKNTVVQDFRYIVSSALFLIGNLSGFQTDLTTAGDTSYGSVQKQLSASLLPQGEPQMSTSVLLHTIAWKQCFCVEVVQLVNTAALPDCN